MKKILILGASGGCGQWLVKMAAERGYEVTALIRENRNLASHPNVTIRYGDVLKPAILTSLLTDQHVVISCLGIRRKIPRYPWSKLLSPPDFMTRVITSLLPLMKEQNINKLIVVSAAGVAESFNYLSRPIKYLVRSGKIGVAYRDLEKMESVLENSNIDWLAVRPVTLIGGAPNGSVRIVNRYTSFSMIRRSNVANWILDTLASDEPFKDSRVMIG